MSAIPYDQIVFWLLAAASFSGAATVVFAREVMRMTLGLGVFLIAVAGWFLYFGHPFLAAAQVFVYVGGVLVLVLFAIMMLQRSAEGLPELTSRHAIDAAIIAIGVAALTVTALRDHVPATLPPAASAEGTPLAEVLLTTYLPHFELAGVLLLVALVAAVVIMGGERE
jgi:NADH:ubiquinone oxidoreductase subunit 6 (subunit J)